jgi:hypothetical protein
MKRREFLKRTGQAVALAALPVAMIASAKTVGFEQTGGFMYSEELSDRIREILKKDVSETMDEIAFEGLLRGEIGHYESVRFIEKPIIQGWKP